MKQGELVNDFRVPPHPKGISLEGSLVTLEPLTASQFANELFLSHSMRGQTKSIFGILQINFI